MISYSVVFHYTHEDGPRHGQSGTISYDKNPVKMPKSASEDELKQCGIDAFYEYTNRKSVCNGGYKTMDPELHDVEVTGTTIEVYAMCDYRGYNNENNENNGNNGNNGNSVNNYNGYGGRKTSRKHRKTSRKHRKSRKVRKSRN